VFERFPTWLSAWTGLVCAIAAVATLLLTWAFVTPEQKSDVLKSMFRSVPGVASPKSASAVTTVPGYPQQSGTIAGVWNGKIFYTDGRAPKPFTFTFDAVGCRGRGDEPNTFGDQTSARLYSNLECPTNTLTPGQIFKIKKTYDGTAGATHSLVYTGTVSSDMRRISGQWAATNTSGTFVLQR